MLSMDESDKQDLSGFDLIDSLPKQDTKVVDLVQDVFDHPHQNHCDYRPHISETGQVYCLTCGSNVASVNDLSEVFCPACDCFRTCHSVDTGACLQCGNQCRLRF